jgi:hypothetical protein
MKIRSVLFYFTSGRELMIPDPVFSPNNKPGSPTILVKSEGKPENQYRIRRANVDYSLMEVVEDETPEEA